MKSKLVIFLISLSSALAAHGEDVISSWASAASGVWNANANWLSTPMPNLFPSNGNGGAATFDAAITATGSAYNVTLNTNITVEDLLVNSANATVEHTTGTFVATSGLSLQAGSYRLNGGTIANTAINQTGGLLRFSSSTSNILDGVMVSGALQLSDSSAVVRLRGGSSFTQADLTSSLAKLLIEGTAGANPSFVTTLHGATINLAATFGLSGNVSLTLAPDSKVRGRGFISSDQLVSGAGSLINQGLISSDVSGGVLTINPDGFSNSGTVQSLNASTLTINASTFTNTGTVEAAGGSTINLTSTDWSNSAGILSVADTAVLNLGGIFTSPGAISRVDAGGTVNVTGLFDNTGQTFTLNSATGDFALNGGGIKGGTLAQAGGTLRFTSNSNNFLDGVAITGTLALPEAFSAVRLSNGANFTQADLSGVGTRLLIQGTSGANSAFVTTLSGATVNLDALNAAFGLSGNVTLTLAPTTAVRGIGYISCPVEGTPGTGTLVNRGLISADVAGTALSVETDIFTNEGTVRAINGAFLLVTAPAWSNAPTGQITATSSSILSFGGAWNNAGTISITNSTLNLGGTFSTADLGSINRTGGAINVFGVWNNAGATYTLNSTTGDLRLVGTIRGGTINQNGASLRMGSSFATTLDAVVVNGTLLFTEDEANVRLINGATFARANLTARGSELVIEGTTGTALPFVTALHGATVNLDAGFNETFGFSGNLTLTLGATSTIRGAGVIRSDVNFGGLSTLINQGRISADRGAISLAITPDVFTNAGLLEASNSSQIITRGFTQTGGITRLNSGTLTTNGTGSVSIEGGRIEGRGTIDSPLINAGTIAPGLSAGTLLITKDLSLSSTSIIEIEIGGLTQETQYDLLSEAGTVALTLNGTLSLSLINGFIPLVGQTFTVVSSNQALAGAFSNVAAGARLTTTDGVSSFQVNYGSGSQNVILSNFVVPEPTAVALWMLGVGLLASGRRRARIGR